MATYLFCESSGCIGCILHVPCSQILQPFSIYHPSRCCLTPSRPPLKTSPDCHIMLSFLEGAVKFLNEFNPHIHCLGCTPLPNAGEGLLRLVSAAHVDQCFEIKIARMDITMTEGP